MAFAEFMDGQEISLETNTMKIGRMAQQEPAGSMVNANAWSAATGELWSGKRALAYLDGNRWNNVMLPAPPNTEPKPCRANNSIRTSPDGKRIWACSKQLFVCIDAESHDFLDISTKHLQETCEDILEDKIVRVWDGNERGLFLAKESRR